MNRASVCLLIVCLTLSACAMKSTVQSRASIEFPPVADLRVGVMPFSARNTAEGNAVADEVTIALMAIPHMIFIERTRMIDILNDHGIDPGSDFWFSNIPVAETAGVDAFLLGTVSLYETRTEDFNRKSYVSFDARLVDARSGKVLYLLSANGVAPDVPPNVVAQKLATQAVQEFLYPLPAQQ